VAGSARSLKARARRRRRRAVAATPVVDVPHAEDQMAESQELLKLITQEIDTNKFEDEHWEGSFSQYLERIDENPFIVRTAHQRVYDMVLSYGTEEVERLKRKFVHYKFFDDPIDEGNDALFGLEDSLQRLMNVFKAAAHNFGPERRVLLLHGPVGSSKSTIVRLLKKGLEAYSRSAEGALYTFDWVIEGEKVRSMMNEEPLLLVPPGPRQRLLDHLNEKTRCSYKFKLDFDLSPISRFYYDKLMREYKGDWQKVLEHVQVRRLLISRAGPRWYRHLPAQGREEPGLDGAHRRHQLPKDRRVRLRFRSARLQFRRRVQHRQPRRRRVRRGFQAGRGVPLRSPRRHAGAQDQAEEVRADRHRRGDHRSYERGGVQEAHQQRVHGGAPRPHHQDRHPVHHEDERRDQDLSKRLQRRAHFAASTWHRTRSKSPRCGRC
jgi:hypothetical protein